MPRIKQEVVQEIINRSDLVEIASLYTNLKLRAGRYWGKSPFQTERTPSFNIFQNGQVWYDFPTQKGGDVIKFVQEVENLDFVGSLEWLAQRYGIEIEHEFHFDPRQRMLDTMRNYQKMYHQNLLGNGDAMRYLTEERQLSEETIRHFGIGLCPRGEAVYDDILETVGLIKRFRDTEQWYWAFFDRIVFPIRDVIGNVVAFGGRTWMEGDHRKAKYINSPETVLYKKGKQLFGLYENKMEIRGGGAIVTEGYLDVCGLHTAGTRNAVATCGTAIDASQIITLSRFTDNIITYRDAGDAGKRATYRDIEKMLSKDIYPEVWSISPTSDGKSLDPDDIRKGGHEDLLIKHTTFVDFWVSEYEGFGGDVVKRRWVLDQVVSALSGIPDILARKVFAEDAAKKLGISKEAFIKAVNYQAPVTYSSGYKEEDTLKYSEEYQLVAMLLKFHDKVEEGETYLDHFIALKELWWDSIRSQLEIKLPGFASEAWDFDHPSLQHLVSILATRPAEGFIRGLAHSDFADIYARIYHDSFEPDLEAMYWAFYRKTITILEKIRIACQEYDGDYQLMADLGQWIIVEKQKIAKLLY